MFDVAELGRAIVEQARAPESTAAISAANGDLIVRLDGFAAGASLPYAARRRRVVNRLVRQWAGRIHLRPLVLFKWSDAIARVEVAIKAVLSSSFGAEPEAVSVAVGKHSLVSVNATFIDPLPMKGPQIQQIRSLLERILKSAGGRLRERGLYISVPHPVGTVPTLAEIIRAVRVAQPATLEQLAASFKQRGFAELTSGVLNSQLDLARMRGLLTQTNGRFFALTARGIAASPPTTGRKSPDIERALALGRRREYHHL